MGRAVVIVLLLAALGLTVGASYERDTDRVSDFAGNGDTDRDDDTPPPDEAALPATWSPPRVVVAESTWPPIVVPESRSLPVAVPPPTA